MKVSRLCVGTWNFGTYTDKNEAFRILDTALDAGINYIDTSNAYPAEGLRGLSESIIGQWFAQGGGRREKTVMATKVFSWSEDPNDGPNDGHGLSVYKIRRHLHASLRRLQTDHLELYQMHHVDPCASWAELWDVFGALFAQGKIDYVGSCNFAGWNLMQAQQAAQDRRILGLVSEQHKYNLLCRLPELELLPAARHLGIGVLPYSPLAEGYLAGQGMRGSSPGRRKQIDSHTEAGQKLLAQVNAYTALCDELGEAPADVALAWLLANPAVTSVITGPRTVEQMTSVLRAVEISLEADTLRRLDEIFPGPGGEAPMAYAW